MLVKNGTHKDLKWLEELKLPRQSAAYSTSLGGMYCCDSLEMLRKMPSDSVDLVMTSPPFALTRKKEYGNEPIDRYLEWFMPFCLEIKRVLKSNGSFVLDIGGAWIPGVPFEAFTTLSLR